MEKYIEIGQIVNTHGLKGEIKVKPWTDFPEVFENFDCVFTKDRTKYNIEKTKYQKGCVLLKLNEVDSIEDAEKMRNTVLYVKRELFDSLPENTYLVADIIGLKVKSIECEYGTVTDVITTGSNDVYVVNSEEYSQILIPAIKDVIKEININKGYILVDMPKGLIG